MSNKRSLLGATTVCCLVFGLAGCSGGDGGAASSAVKSNSATAPDTGQPPPVAADAFITRVLAVINSTSETAEPTEIESTTVTSPEDVAPVPAS